MITEIGHFALILALATAIVQSVAPCDRRAPPRSRR
jgi:cytochrome c biogenesis factor